MLGGDGERSPLGPASLVSERMRTIITSVAPARCDSSASAHDARLPDSEPEPAGTGRERRGCAGRNLPEGGSVACLGLRLPFSSRSAPTHRQTARLELQLRENFQRPMASVPVCPKRAARLPLLASAEICWRYGLASSGAPSELISKTRCHELPTLTAAPPRFCDCGADNICHLAAKPGTHCPSY